MFERDTAEYAPADDHAEAKPLEEIGRLANDLERMGVALNGYLMRFNGPRPVAGALKGEGPNPPSCYRAEIERLRRAVIDMGEITDAVIRIG